MSRWPEVEEWTSWPLRLTTMCHPASFLLVDVPLEVPVDAGESFGGESGLVGVDLDLQCAHGWSMADSEYHRRADR